MTNTFVWTDLSTFDIRAAKQFYRQSLGWRYQDLGDGYLSCEAASGSAAGLFVMPELFQKINMPSFWMSYIRVADLQETVRAAEAHGAKVEIQPQPAPGGGQIALIRDPAGAGFTCYQGSDLVGRPATEAPGRMIWNELHVSDLERVRPFYTHVFGWHIRPAATADRYEIFGDANAETPLAGIQVTSNALKGDKEYWGVYFAVETLDAAAEQIARHGGTVVAEQPLGRRSALLAYDPQGAAFYVVGMTEGGNTEPQATPGNRIKWRAVLGLIGVAGAVLTEVEWVWGLLFLLWVLPDLRRGSTHFLEYIERQHNPVLYWLIMATWVGLSLYLLAEAALTLIQ